MFGGELSDARLVLMGVVFPAVVGYIDDVLARGQQAKGGMARGDRDEGLAEFGP